MRVSALTTSMFSLPYFSLSLMSMPKPIYPYSVPPMRSPLRYTSPTSMMPPTSSITRRPRHDSSGMSARRYQPMPISLNPRADSRLLTFAATSLLSAFSDAAGTTHGCSTRKSCGSRTLFHSPSPLVAASGVRWLLLNCQSATFIVSRWHRAANGMASIITAIIIVFPLVAMVCFIGGLIRFRFYVIITFEMQIYCLE